MKLIGVDVDGCLLPLKGRRDNLIAVRDALHDEIVSGSHCILVTSRENPRQAQQEVWDQCGVNLECAGVSRDWPSLKGEWLRKLYSDHAKYDAMELWDDEPWYLNPAYALGITCRVVVRGALEEFHRVHDYVPWVPKTPQPVVAFLPRL